MRSFIASILVWLCFPAAYAQSVVGTPNAMYLVYNTTNNYFYLKIDGKEKSSTEIQNMYQVDSKIIQVLTVKKSEFIPQNFTSTKQSDILMHYYRFEREYLDTIFQKQISYSVEMHKTVKGREFIFWTYHSLLPRDTTATDTTLNAPIEKQLYVATVVGPLVVGASTAYFKGDSNFEELREFLFNIMESVTISPKRIDVYQLNKQVNGI